MFKGFLRRQIFRRNFTQPRLGALPIDGNHPAAAAFLLDGFRPGLQGGTGMLFDWSLARRAARYGTIVLAGGLRPENVVEAISRVRPYAIDVCSGVESLPGKKDPKKLRELMRQVEQMRRKRR